MIELIVVVLLLTILLGFAIPAFQGHALIGAQESAARELLAAVKKLKVEALRGQRVYALHLDLDRSSLWVNREEEKAEDEPGSAPPPEWVLEGDTRITQVHLPDGRDVRSGTVVIRFYPQGYSDRAIIRLAGAGQRPTDLVIEAFLPTAFIVSEGDPPAF